MVIDRACQLEVGAMVQSGNRYPVPLRLHARYLLDCVVPRSWFGRVHLGELACSECPLGLGDLPVHRVPQALPQWLVSCHEGLLTPPDERSDLVAHPGLIITAALRGFHREVLVDLLHQYLIEACCFILGGRGPRTGLQSYEVIHWPNWRMEESGMGRLTTVCVVGWCLCCTSGTHNTDE